MLKNDFFNNPNVHSFPSFPVVTPTGFDAGYLHGFEEREDEVNWLVNGWVEKNIKPCLNPGFQEYWRREPLALSRRVRRDRRD